VKLWDKGTPLNAIIEQFTVGKDRELDLSLARWDILGSLAHITMLESIGLMEKEELRVLKKELIRILKEVVGQGKFTIEEGVEDVHSQIEMMLTAALGDAGKKIHSGRSRNDQVLVDLKLFFRHEIRELAGLTTTLFETLTQLSEKHREVLMPGYTHMQVAMPSSFGLWFGAYAESLSDDLHLLQAAYKISNQNPLGSAAGYGSSFPLNRTLTTNLLGFEDLSYNVVYAQMGRGKTERSLAFALASLAGTLGKFAMDICLYNGQNFNFFRFPKELTTGSSIMPHKANPDVFELLRARCNRLQALPNTIGMITGNLPAGYHRDLQLIKEEILPAIDEMKACLEVFNFSIRQIEVNDDILREEKYDYLFTVEEVNEWVLKGVPFREAYRKVGEKIAAGNYHPERKIAHQHEGSIGHLCTEEIKNKFYSVISNMHFSKVDEALGALIEE